MCALTATAPLTWRIHPDGSFDCLAPGAALLGSYPAIDGIPIRPISVESATTCWQEPLICALTVGAMR